MKYIKSIAILAMAAISLNMFAAVTAKVNIMVSAPAIADGGSGMYDQILLVEDDATAADFSNSNNGPKIMNTHALGVNVYALNGTNKLGAVAIPDLNGLVVEFKANTVETSYTLTLSDIEGDVKVLRNGVEIESPYAITCTANEVIQFTIAKAHVYTRTVTAGQWGTICLPQSVDADKITNATIYSVVDKTETALYLEDVTAAGMDAATPYIFKADAAGDVKFAYNNDAVTDPVAATGLVGTFVDTYIGVEEMYVISNNVVRLATSTSTVKANRAYIDLTFVPEHTTLAPGRKLVPVRIANGTTDIENAAEAAEIEKQIVNGQLLIRKAGVLYNVQGQIVK